MNPFAIDIGEIADLKMQVAGSGAIRVVDTYGDGMFEFIVGIAVLIYELFPNP